jgi:hypothetical protein
VSDPQSMPNAPASSPSPAPSSTPAPSPAPPSRLPGPAAVEHTKWSPGLLGFYASCAGVSIGAAVAFGAWKFFESTGGLVFGAVLAGVSSVTCFLTLSAARRPPSATR